MFSKILLIVGCVAATAYAADLSCVDESGKPVDWYIVYKIPRQPNGPAPLNTGYSYGFITSKGDKKAFKLSDKLVTDEESIFGKTLAPLHADPKAYSHVMYNDAPPHGAGSESSYRAHAKGVFALDKTNGFWLIHSIPKFAQPPTKKYEYPDTGKDNGQTALCISIKTKDEGADIVKQLKHSEPNIYNSFETEEVLAVLPDFKDLGKRNFKTPEDKSIETITSKGKVDFISFARNKKAATKDEDLYANMVAKELGQDLVVETWRRGAGTPLESDCKAANKVSNVNEMKITFAKGSSQPDSGVWPYARDHSKWAMSQDPKKPYVCIGDINRMKSQFKRGGGTVCVNDKEVWTVFRDAVADIESCKKQ